MGLEIVFLPEALDRTRADLLHPCHRPATPVRRAFRFTLQGRINNGSYFVVGIQSLSTTSGLNLPYALQPLALKPFPPQRRRVSVHVQFFSDLQVLFTFGRHQQNARAKRHLLRSELRANPLLELISISFRQEHDTRNLWHAHEFDPNSKYV